MQEGIFFLIISIMKVAEIQVSYSNTNLEKLKVTNSQILFEIASAKWDRNLIELQEEVKLMLLNRANIVLGIHDLAKGGISGAVVDIRIILAIALKCNASGIVLMHNHPSGNLKASQADIDLTRKLKEACNLLDLSLLDHLIIT